MLTIDQFVNFQTFQKLMKKLFIISFMNTSMINYFLVNVQFVGNIVLITAF